MQTAPNQILMAGSSQLGSQSLMQPVRRLSSFNAARGLACSFRFASLALTGSHANPIHTGLASEPTKISGQMLAASHRHGLASEPTKISGQMLAASHRHGLASEAYVLKIARLIG
jgi:hypothetical protein